MKLLSLLLLLLPQISNAHVKWFSNYDFEQAPLTLSQLNHPVFWGLFLLSVVCMPILVGLDRVAERNVLYQRTTAFLDRYSDQGPLIMRVAMGAVLLMSWQGDSFIAPEIEILTPALGWLQFLMALFLLFKETTIMTGVGMVLLYILGITQHGIFHMLDYVVYPAVGLYLAVSYLKTEKFRHLDLPILYSGLGFSLCWVAFEKMIYPYWGLSVLAKAPALSMGLDHQFFLLACAFVEFSLGYLLIICLLHRPLAIIVTLTFFTTTLFFGKTEIIGHTILHGALLVFIVKGPGYYYQAPIRIHKSPWLRSLFASVNFVILFALMAFPYEKMAQTAHAESMKDRPATVHPSFEVPVGTPVPSVKIQAVMDPNGGWNLKLTTNNFSFSPAKAGGEDLPGEGHAHLYVNNKKVGRIYSSWHHVILDKGVNKIKVSLNTNSHKDYFNQGNPIEDIIEVEEHRNVHTSHQH